jgi:hypothetical protein
VRLEVVVVAEAGCTVVAGAAAVAVGELEEPPPTPA